MSINKYFANVTKELLNKSEEIKDFFASHRPTAGTNRESKVANLLQEYLPTRYEIGSGLILSKDGEFSNQADVIIADKMSNSPLFASEKEKIWLVESVYSLIEVKTQLTPSTLTDSLEKCRRFKTLPRVYASDFGRQNVKESIFVLWSFEGPSAETIKNNYIELTNNIPVNELPDFIIVPGSTIIVAGQYYEMTVLGQPNSQRRRELIEKHGNDINQLLGEGYLLYNLGEDTLLAFLIWITSWLHSAGERRADLVQYVPREHIWGKNV